ncbi:MAG: phage tail tape measure protein [Actinomycetota bacterium]|nr:phage tail tape measure protein [Actinomycetota bacterium]
MSLSVDEVVARLRLVGRTEFAAGLKEAAGGLKTMGKEGTKAADDLSTAAGRLSKATADETKATATLAKANSDLAKAQVEAAGSTSGMAEYRLQQKAATADQAASDAALASGVKASAKAEADAAAQSEAALARRTKAMNSFAKIGKGTLLGIGAAAAAVGYESVKAATEFQTAMTRLTTSAGESTTNIAMLTKGIYAMAPTVGAGPAAIAKGLYLIEGAGFHGAAALDVVKASAQGAKIEGSNLVDTGNALTTVLKDLNAPGSQAANIMSKMVAAVGQGKMSLQDFSGSIHSVLPNATALGISLDQVAGAVATMTAQGISADQATQNLNHAIVALANPTAVMTKSMANYGVSAAQIQADLGKQGLTGTYTELSRAILQHMGPAGTTLLNSFNTSKIAAEDAGKMFAGLGPQAQGMAKAYTAGSLSLGDYRKALRALPGPQASLAMQWMTMQNQSQGFNSQLRAGKPAAQTFAGAMASMTGGLTGLQVGLHLTGGHMADFVSAVAAVSAAQKNGQGNVEGWSKVQQNLGVQLSQAGAAAQVLGTQLGMWLIPKISAVVKVVTQAVNWLGKHSDAAKALAAVIGGVLVVAVAAFAGNKLMAGGKAIGSLVNGFKLLIPLTRAATVAQLAEDAAMDANPVGAIIIALMALGAVIYLVIKHWHDITQAVKDFIVQHKILAVIIGLVLWPITSVIAAIVGVIWVINHWGEVTKWFSHAWSDAWNWVKQAAKDVIDWITSPQGIGILLAVLGPAGALIVGAAEMIKHWRGIWDTAKTIVQDATNFIINVVINPFISLLNTLLAPFGVSIGKVGNVNIAGAPAPPKTVTGPSTPAVKSAAGTAAGLAAGGFIPALVGGGFMTAGPRAIVGEGRSQWPEFVVPTDPQHRANATALYAALGGHLMMAVGGTLPTGAPSPAKPSGGGGIGGVISGIAGAVGGVASGAASGVAGAAGSLASVGGGIVSGALSAAGGVASAAIGAAAGPLKDAALAIANHLPLPVFRGVADNVINRIYTYVTTLGNTLSSGPAGGAGGPGGGGGAGGGSPYTGGGNLQAWINQALTLMGMPLTFGAGIANLISHESGGNPNAVNNWDSNAKAGHPSKGLMQTIQGVFDQYVLPSERSAGIFDPVANITAGVRYALQNYGPGMLMAGGRHSAGGGYLGYGGGGIIPAAMPLTLLDEGGIIPRGFSAVLNNTGAPEPLARVPVGAGVGASGGSAGTGDAGTNLVVQVVIDRNGRAVIGEAVLEHIERKIARK